jgi:uncharacterized OB-fold protein
VASQAPAPVADLESARWWEALREHRIVLQRCDAQGHLRFPPMPACPYCGARGHTEVEVSGRGRVYAMVRVHRALTPAMAGEVPYAVATVELDEGPRVVARLEEGDGRLRIDAAVRPVFVDHEGWTELRFAPAGAAVAG